MALKNRPDSGNRRRRPRAEEEEAEAKPVNREKFGPGFWGNIAALVSVLGMIGAFIMSGPYTHAGSMVIYTPHQMVDAAFTNMGNPAAREAMLKKYGIDYSLLFAPKDINDEMRRLQKACLPGTPPEPVISFMNKPHRVYGVATDYMICAMTYELPRLCQSSERKRLVEQLMQYRERRQNLRAIERLRTAMTGGKIAQTALKRAQRAVEAIEGRSAMVYTNRIGMELDVRVGESLRNLVKAGYITPVDFGYLGLYQPAEYEPYLNDDPIGDACS